VRRLLPSRNVLAAYTLAGLAIGIGISVWIFGTEVKGYYVHSDGSISSSSDRAEWQYDDRSGKYHTVYVSDGRPLSSAEKVFVRARESFPIWILGALVGLIWGIVHLGLRADQSNQRDQDHLDYCDSITSNLPPGSS
jgi:hypothetical protein